MAPQEWEGLEMALAAMQEPWAKLWAFPAGDRDGPELWEEHHPSG